MKFLSPPPEQDPKHGKTVQNLSKLTFLRGGWATQSHGQTILLTSGVSLKVGHSRTELGWRTFRYFSFFIRGQRNVGGARAGGRGGVGFFLKVKEEEGGGWGGGRGWFSNGLWESVEGGWAKCSVVRGPKLPPRKRIKQHNSLCTFVVEHRHPPIPAFSCIFGGIGQAEVLKAFLDLSLGSNIQRG